MRVHLHRCRKLSSHLRADAMVSLGQSHIFKRFSTRFPLIAARAAVVSDEVLASQAGLDVLRRGGNAADAALAMSACMGVLQTYTTGVGGDCFALYYDAQTKKTHCVDGSGRSPAVLTLEQVEARSHVEGAFLKQSAGLYATVPGVAKAWFYIVSRFGSGKLNLCELLEPAVYCAEHGFPMDHVKQGMLISCLDRLKQIPGGHYFLDAGSQIPRIGQIITNRPLGALLKVKGRLQDGINGQKTKKKIKSLAQGGPQVIYEGPVARSIVDAVCQACGVLTNGDLAEHLVSTEPLEVEPVSTTCRGDVTVYTTPLPTQGVVLLETLNILEGFDLRVLRHVPGDFEHLVIEALRHAIADGLRHVADGASGGSVQEMLSKEHAGKLREQVNLHRRAECVYPEGAVHHGLSDTTFSAAADGSGNVCALMGSISNFFGCAVVQEYRFSVQARGTGFNLEANHPKCFGPRKKPYHSVMPVMVTDAQTHDWLCTMGTLGGLPQPIILAQVLLNMMELGLDPQQALAKPRMILGSPFHPHPDGSLTVEADFPEELLRSLPRRGHTTQDKYASDVEHDVGNTNVRAKAARWCVHEETAGSRVSGDNAIWCGSEPRTAAAALGY